MALWVVRAGKNGEQEPAALENAVIAIGWNDLGDLSKVKSKEEVERLYRQTYKDESSHSIATQVGQIWSFLSRIQVKDLVAIPLKGRSAVAVGVVQSGYEYRSDLGEIVQHTRKVKWLRSDLPRTSFEQDILYSFGGLQTVYQVSRNDAENRVRAMAEGKSLPQSRADREEQTDVVQRLDIEQVAADEIKQYLSRKFRGHELARLVDELLKAQGYVTRKSAPGPDGGADILAGAGPLGFDHPRLCVQVKSSDSPLDVGVFRELLGTMKTKGAEFGLLVGWGGFKPTVLKEATSSYFNVRLWDQGELLNQIEGYYDRLPEALRAELPLKRI